MLCKGRQDKLPVFTSLVHYFLIIFFCVDCKWFNMIQKTFFYVVLVKEIGYSIFGLHCKCKLYSALPNWYVYSFSDRNLEASKNVCNPVVRYRKIKSTQLVVSCTIYVTKENTKGLPNDKPFVCV